MPREKREAILDEFEKSGMPAVQFCNHYGIGQQTFSTWVQKRSKRSMKCRLKSVAES